MEMRRLGVSGLKVSEIAIGCADMGSTIDQAGADAIVGAAVDAGINLFDSADAYSGGESESILGKALKGRRQDAIVSTKFGLPVGQGANDRGGSRRHIMNRVEVSLKRLATDYIDLYQIHWPDPQTPIEETLGALDDLVTQGKVRYIGSSNFPAWLIADADWVARTQRLNRFVSAQNNYSLLAPETGGDVLDACGRFGLGLMAFAPLAGGMLSGRYRRGEPPPEGSRMALMPFYADILLHDVNFDRMDRLTAFASARGRNTMELGIAWLLAQPRVSTVIAGAGTPERLQPYLAATDWKLTPEEVAEINGLVR